MHLKYQILGPRNELVSEIECRHEDVIQTLAFIHIVAAFREHRVVYRPYAAMLRVYY